MPRSARDVCALCVLCSAMLRLSLGSVKSSTHITSTLQTLHVRSQSGDWNLVSYLQLTNNWGLCASDLKADNIMTKMWGRRLEIYWPVYTWPWGWTLQRTLWWLLPGLQRKTECQNHNTHPEPPTETGREKDPYLYTPGFCHNVPNSSSQLSFKHNL